ncbi:hypothetical protein [Exiguobacterium sp. s127]|uniref:hypothetical protein n=1 Tax=Exiguobacterium sp. s127 TaxID=2751210 RepID=UPI001BE9798A|nr:hypothetical protein [Exiguobacterium sp. s127]
MNFRLVVVSEYKKLRKLTKKNFIFGNNKKNEHLSVIHNFDMKNNISHLVYHLKDEYCISTIAMGEQFKIPYSSLINLFYNKKNKIVFIEHSNLQTDQLVKNELSSKTEGLVNEKLISNLEFINVFKEFETQIIKISYVNNDLEEYHENDYMIEEEFLNIANNNAVKINYITFSIDNKLMSLYEEGKVTINNDDEEYLISVVERLYSCLKE